MSANVLSFRFRIGEERHIVQIAELLLRAHRELSESEDKSLMINADLENGLITFALAAVEVDQKKPDRLNTAHIAQIILSCLKLKQDQNGLRIVTPDADLPAVGTIETSGL